MDVSLPRSRHSLRDRVHVDGNLLYCGDPARFRFPDAAADFVWADLWARCLPGDELYRVADERTSTPTGSANAG